MEAGRQVVRRRRLNEPAWREVLQRFDGAGMTVEDFCRAEGLCRSSFTRWRGRLRTPAQAARPVAAKASSPEAPAAFVDLGLLGSVGAPALPALDLRIELGGGVVLHLVRR
jgi:putative transposase